MSAATSNAVIWHDLECGGYRQDLALWLDLAAHYGAPVLDIGAGTGRVSLALARAGREVVALDLDDQLLRELTVRAQGLPVTSVCADARAFSLRRKFPLIIVPMQTVQLLGGASARARFLSAVHAHLQPEGVVAVALSDTADFEEFEWQDGDPYPLPDVVDLDGWLFSSQPTAVRRDGDTFVLERRRSSVDPDGTLSVSEDRIALDVLPAAQLEFEVAAAGLRTIARRVIPATGDHIASQVVIFGA